MTAFSFSYAPKASSALASINPIQSRGEGLRFTANTPMSFIKQNPEIVTEGFWKGRQALTEGIVKGTTSALSGIADALKQKAADAKADTKLKEDRAHEMALAKIKAAPTAAETAYQQQRSDLLAQQIEAAKVKNKEDAADDEFDAIPSGAKNWSSYSRPNFNQTEDAMTDPAGNVITPSVPVTPPSSAPPASTAPTAQPNVSSIFRKSSNPAFVTLRDKLAQKQETPQESNIFSNISAITEKPSQLDQPYTLTSSDITASPQLQFPESEGNLALAGETLPLMPVSGAEGKPLAATPPVEPALPQTAPNKPAKPALAQAVPETEAEYRYRVESDLTGQPFMSPADARMAKNILERELGVKAKVNGIDAGKGKRIYRVEVVEDALSPMEGVPKDMVVKSVTEKDGTQTRVLIPKMPVEQQLKTVDVAIDRAKTLKTTIEKIRGIAGGMSPGTGKFSNLLNKLPIQTDASTVRALNNTIKGLIGFQELVDLKAQGGSLGALSDAELGMLTSLQGSLDVDNLNSETYLEMLKDIETKTIDVEKKMEAQKKELMSVEKPTKYQPIQTPENRVEIKTQAEYNALKSGQKFIFDGRPGTK